MNGHFDRFLLASAVLFCGLSPLQAHHAANVFFGGPEVLVTGTLTGSRIMNPHSYFRVTMDDGTEWVFETAASGSMIRNDGMTEEDFGSGQRVAMSGESNRDGRKVARVRSIVFYGEAATDDAELVFIGSRPPQEAWYGDIRNSAQKCWEWEDTSLVKCFRVSQEVRARIDEDYGAEAMLW